MHVVLELAKWSALTIAALLLLGQLFAHEIGYWLGSFRRRSVQKHSENIGVVVTGMLGLLAFLLALTLSYSTTRFSERREGALLEANSIGTAWLRAKLISDGEAAPVAKLIEDYASIRLQFAKLGQDETILDELNARTSALQTSIWKHVTEIADKEQTPVTVSFLTSVNEMFDATTAQRVAFSTQLPWQVFWLLIGAMVISMFSLGYQFGVKGSRVRTLMFALTIVWTAVVFCILDLATPRLGFFRTDTSVYQWTLDGFVTNRPT